MDKMEIVLRFVGYTREEIGGMGENEIFRKTFSTVSLIEDLLSSFGGTTNSSNLTDHFNQFQRY
jgi:hypothetical protein